MKSITFLLPPFQYSLVDSFLSGNGQYQDIWLPVGEGIYRSQSLCCIPDIYPGHAGVHPAYERGDIQTGKFVLKPSIPLEVSKKKHFFAKNNRRYVQIFRINKRKTW